jgi:nucleoside-diphosphate-sugar epimerase
MKKALITGVTGQDGSYLAELLLETGRGQVLYFANLFLNYGYFIHI